ncbi:hypothetical protein HGRIS_000673 [Hohenbuehelia grisea]|uniref:FHA domain-containing protein n=1 Tax=Hohenbuehelia grisea TaxID=104357 RepID=A0ABR3JTS9_9AGAR
MSCELKPQRDRKPSQIHIKDVKSSNGTFINGERLSPEGVESESFELKSDDIVEFGIDIVGEDNKTIIHHKVAARIVCIFNEQDAQIAARAEQHQQSQASLSHHPGSQMHPGPGNNVGSFNFGGPGPSAGPAQRRPPIQQPGIAGMGSLGGSMRPPGKSGLTFDHILSRLQGELQKSRDTGAELHNLNSAMNEIHDTLGGSLPQNLPALPHSLPPVRPPQPQEPPAASDPPPSGALAGQPPPPAALAELHTQLCETQASLQAHVVKIRELEGLLKEHESIKREVSDLRELIIHRQPSNPSHALNHTPSEFDTAADDDDSRSIATITPHELETVTEEDESAVETEDPAESRELPIDDVDLEDEEHDEERRRRREELGRPRTPEPTGLGMKDFDVDPDPRDRSATILASPGRSTDGPILTSDQATSSPTEMTHSEQGRGVSSANLSSDLLESLNARLLALSTQFEGFLALTTSLQAQHGATEATINALHDKVADLEDRVKTTQAQQEAALAASNAAAAAAAASARQAEIAAQAKAESRDESTVESDRKSAQHDSLTSVLAEFKKSVEGQWSTVRNEWAEERSRLAKVAEEWEARAKRVDNGLGVLQLHAATSSSDGAGILPNGIAHPKLNGRTASSGGLVTPPSPRSLSADSGRSRRRRRSGSSRGRSRSRSPGTSASGDEAMTDSTSMTSVSQAGEDTEVGKDAAGEDERVNGLRKRTGPLAGRLGTAKQGSGSLITPASSVHMHMGDGEVLDSSTGTQTPQRRRGSPTAYVKDHPISSTALGVLVIGIAAAVLWNTKLKD